MSRLWEVLTGDFCYKDINIIGFSAGGNIAHVSTFLKSFRKVVLIVTGQSLADIFWNETNTYAIAIRHETEKISSLEEVRRLWLMSDTTKFQAASQCKEFLMINGSFDTLVKPEFALRLQDVIPNVRLFVYPASHFSAACFIKPALDDILCFFRGQPLRQSRWELK